jgi:hypothetical protein
MVALALLLAATPVSVQVDLSRATRERLGQRLEDALRQRLLEEGFELSSPARLTLRIEELHGALRLSATPLGAQPIEREVKPNAEAWRDEVLFEIVLRVVSLAHEAEALLPPSSAPPPPTAVAEEPSPPPEAPAAPEAKEPGLRFGAGVRAGVAFRFSDFDPTFAFHGTVAGYFLEPVVVAGVTLAPGPGLFVTEVPVSGGLRIPLRLRPALTLTGEVLIGARFHLYGASAVDAGGVRVDTILSVGVNTLFHLGALRLGFRLGVEGAAVGRREHVLGDELLWARGPVALLLQLVVER